MQPVPTPIAQEQVTFEGLLPPDPLSAHFELMSNLTAGFQLASAVLFIAFVLLIATRTRLPGRFLIVSGALLRVGAGVWLWGARSYAAPLLGEQMLLACVAAFGMVLAGVGVIRLALAVVSRSPMRPQEGS